MLYRVTTEFSGPLTNGGGVSQMHFDADGGTSAAAAVAVSTFWTAINANMHSSVAWTRLGEIELLDEASLKVVGVESTDAVSSTGQFNTDPLPPATQGLVRWRTGVYIDGREIRGRTFLPGMLESNNTNGAPVASLVTNFTTAAQNLIGASGSTPVVISRANSAFAAMVTANAWSKWAQLRSRRD